MSSRRGMTLLEIMTVVGIIGMMSALSVMGFSEMRLTARARETSRGMLTMLRGARTLAVTTGVPHGVYFGGSQDVLEPLMRNSMVLFRKPTFDAVPANDWAAGDRRSTTFQVPTNRNVTPLRMTIPTLDIGTDLPTGADTAPGGAGLDMSLRIVFDPDGRPTVTSTDGSVVTPVPFFATPSPRIVFRLRDLTAETGGPVPNRTARCIELLSTGATRSYSDNSGFCI